AYGRCRPGSELLLEVETVVLHVRGAQLLADREHIAGREVGEHWARARRRARAGHRDLVKPARCPTYLQRFHVRSVGKENRTCAYTIEHRAGIRRVKRKLPGEEVLRERVIGHTPAGPQYGFTAAERVVGHSDARREILVILGIQAAGSAANAYLLQSDTRAEDAEQTVFLANHAKVVPANTIVDGQLMRVAETVLQIESMIVLEGVAETVLQIESMIVLEGVAMRIAGHTAASRNLTRQEIIQSGCCNDAGIGSYAVAENELAAVVGIERLDYRSSPPFITEFPVVFSGAVGKIRKELPVCIHAPARHRLVR